MLLDEMTEKPLGGYQRIDPFGQLNIRDTTIIIKIREENGLVGNSLFICFFNQKYSSYCRGIS